MNNSIELSDIELEAVVGGVLDTTNQGNLATSINANSVTNTTLQAGVLSLGDNTGNVGTSQANSTYQNNDALKLLSL